MVSGRKLYRHPSRLDRGYVMEKLLVFHREHGTPPHEIVGDLQRAAEQIPKQNRLEEAAPLRTTYERCRRSRRKGPQEIGTILVAVLARLGINALESKPEARPANRERVRSEHLITSSTPWAVPSDAIARSCRLCQARRKAWRSVGG